jgi:hypothetical protein
MRKQEADLKKTHSRMVRFFAGVLSSLMLLAFVHGLGVFSSEAGEKM